MKQEILSNFTCKREILHLKFLWDFFFYLFPANPCTSVVFILITDTFYSQALKRAKHFSLSDALDKPPSALDWECKLNNGRKELKWPV